MIKLKNELTIVFENKDEKKIIAFFDYISWITSKIENRSFAEVVRDRVNKN